MEKWVDHRFYYLIILMFPKSYEKYVYFPILNQYSPVIQPFLLSFIPVTQFESPSRLACVSKHDSSTLKERSVMEGVGTHQKFLIPLVFPQLWWDHKKADNSGTVTLLIAWALELGDSVKERVFSVQCEIMAISTTAELGCVEQMIHEWDQIPVSGNSSRH